MKRIPTLHIREDVFRAILEEVMEVDDVGGLVQEVMLRAAKFSVTNRSVTITNEKLLKKVQTVNTASRDITSTFGNLLYFVRKKRNKYIKADLPKPGSREYNMQKEVAIDAHNFCKRYKLEEREGFIRYIELGLDKMKTYAIYKFKNLYEGICRTHESLSIIENDPYKEITDRVYQYYARKVMESVGIPLFDYKENPDKYAYFALMTQEAKKFLVPERIWIDAQFESFDSRGRYPEPEQLVGPKARARVQTYMLNNDIKIHNRGKNNNRNTK